MGEPISKCCVPTVGLVQRTGQAMRCSVCGDFYIYDPATAPADDRPALLPAAPTMEIPAPVRRSSPGAAPDERVQVADEARLRPSTVAPIERVTHVEDPELVEVRCALAELRPDRGGPFGWSPDGQPPEGMGSSWTPSLGVQCSPDVPAILPGAFASLSPVSRAPNFDLGFWWLADGDRATLRWMQRFGTLADGLSDLYVACAEAIAPQDVRAKWAALPEKARSPARMLHGRKRVRVAITAWRAGETATATVVQRRTPAQHLGDAVAASAMQLGSAVERATATATATGEVLAKAGARLGGGA